MSERNLTQAEVKERLSYDPLTGKFTWLETGKEAGTPDANAYLRLYIKGKSYLAHRVAYLYMYGEWPKEQIDHVNHKPWDNRLVNIRPASRFQNAQNMRPRQKPEGSKYKGVRWDQKAQAWCASIQANNRRYRIPGFFKSAYEAHQAYCAFALVLHGQFRCFDRKEAGKPTKDEPNG